MFSPPLVRAFGMLAALVAAAALPAQPTGPESGFVSIFNGRTLAGWDGDSTYWRVVGELDFSRQRQLLGDSLPGEHARKAALLQSGETAPSSVK